MRIDPARAVLVGIVAVGLIVLIGLGRVSADIGVPILSSIAGGAATASVIAGSSGGRRAGDRS